MRRAFTLCLLMFLMPAEAGEFSDFGAGIGRMNECRDLNREIVRNWLTLKDHMAPGQQQEEKDKKTKRPSRRDFECISAQYMRRLNEISSRGSLRLRCYEHPEQDVGGFCCDKQLTTCSMYSPRQ